jgi:hypothetical protein
MTEITDFKQQYSDCTSEYLLELRARGDLMVPNAQRAVEELLSERGEIVPPIPSRPVVLKKGDLVSHSRGKPNSSSLLDGLVIAILMIFTMTFAKMFAHTRLGFFIGVLIWVCAIPFFFYRAVQRAAMSPEESAKEVEREKAEEEGLTEMMIAAANGDLTRVKELMQYGANVNVVSKNGGTPLMFAARNGHASIVEFLLAVGADQDRKSDAGRTALDIARSLGYFEIVTLLESQATGCRAAN